MNPADVQSFLQGMAFGTGIMAAIYGFFIDRSRRMFRNSFEEAHEAYDEYDYRAAYQKGKAITSGHRLPFSVSRKIRKEAQLLIDRIEGEVYSGIEDDVEKITEVIPFVRSIDLENGLCKVELRNGNMHLSGQVQLSAISPTYRYYFGDRREEVDGEWRSIEK